ncbi:MAG: hypothetical protein WB561_02540 [Terracidiphilus sp.]
MANEQGVEVTAEISAAINRACEKLQLFLTTTGEDIRATATQFENLEAEVQRVLEFTSGIVGCVQEDWTRSLVPMARKLDQAARRFIEKRIESITAISTVFSSEAGILENLSALAKEQCSIAREASSLGMLASIEVARLGAPGRRFAYMASELNDFANTVSSGAADARNEAERRRTNIIDRQRELNQTLQGRIERFSIIQSELGEAIAAMNIELAELTRIPANFRDCVALIADTISRVVAAVQMQDVTRQQTEHVQNALNRISGAMRCFEHATAQDEARYSAILTIQARQVECARDSTEEWILQVNRCLESILRVGSSDVVIIGAKILDQERGLSTQLSRIERLERECEADDAEIGCCLAELAELVQTTNAHLEHSRQTRDRMRLLNFNSMIEARHLGSQATAILEVTRNIGRISTGWSELTRRSGDALEEMLSSSARAEERHQAITHASMEDLGEAQRESHAALAALTQAAVVARSNGEKIEASVTMLHKEITILSSFAERLTHSVAFINEARRAIGDAGNILSKSRAAPLSENDIQEIESECNASYTSELERQILRSVLRGDPMPAARAAALGNDVELF